MTQWPRLARAGILAWLLLAAGVLAFPSVAAPLADVATPVEAPSDEPPAGTPQPTTAEGPSPSAQGTPPPSPATAVTVDESPTAPGEWTTATPEALPSQPSEDLTSTPSDDPLSPTPEASATISSTDTPSATAPLATGSVTETPTAEPTATPTDSATPSPTASAPSGSPSFDAGAVLINEVAWAGTLASANDEWIELWNPGDDPIDLAGWRLSDGGDLTASLTGAISAHGMYLLERTDDSTVSDIPADKIYTGSLNNAGETLRLLDASGNLIDTANAGAGPWPAGSTSARSSMERHGALDLPGNWSTFPGLGGNGLDADGRAIAGTPRQPNAPVAAPTPTATASGPGPTPFPAEAVIINEVAWAGTLASSSDEWIELLNPGGEPIDLAGWTLTDDGDIRVGLRGTIPAGGYYVLERSDDQAISDQPADRIYTGALSNAGETLRLLDPVGTEIDIVNPSGAAWPAGDASARSSMERLNGRWRTFTGFFGLGHDADGRRVRGTPHGPNSVLFPTPQPTWIPGRVVINEVLVRPHYDWEGAGGVTSDDEFIELYNRGPGPVNLAGWTLDDTVVGGSAAFSLPARTLQPGDFAVFFRSRTHIALNDSGDSVRLSGPDGQPVDKIHYRRVRAYNLSYGRLPDGDEALVYGLWPTPGRNNVLYTPPSYPVGSVVISEVAWSGTAASANDEWIELWNAGPEAVHLDGWVLTDDNDIHVDLTGVLEAGGFFLLERTDDSAVSNVAARAIYTGALADSGERLRLIDPAGKEVDVVNSAGDGWPAGEGEARASMQRVRETWATFRGPPGEALDAGGGTIFGTPGTANAAPPPAEAALDFTCSLGERTCP